MTNRLRYALATWVAIGLLATPQLGRAQAPCSIPLQSYLAGLDGTPLEGPVDVELRFYDGAGPDAVAMDCRTFAAQPLDAGWLSLALDACVLPEPDPSGCGVMTITEILDAGAVEGAQIFMGLRLDDDADDAGPRTPLGAVPYAVFATNAAFAESAGNAATADVAGSLEGFDPTEYVRFDEVGGELVPREDLDALQAAVDALEARLDDMDGDGVPNDEDCEPFDGDIFQTAVEIPDDELDSNCDGDSDGDGVVDELDCAPFDAGLVGAPGENPGCAVASCTELLERRPDAVSGGYYVDWGFGPVEVHCEVDFDDRAWMLVVASSDDGTDTWTWNNRNYWTTDTTTFGSIGALNRDYKADAYHNYPFRDALFVHYPSGVWAAYDDVGDGATSFADVVTALGGMVCYEGGDGYPMTAGTLSGGRMCDTQLYLNALDRDGGSCPSNSTHTHGPAWNILNNESCPFDDPAHASFGGYDFVDHHHLEVAPGDETRIGRGYGGILGLNTGAVGAAENYIHLLVR